MNGWDQNGDGIGRIGWIENGKWSGLWVIDIWHGRLSPNQWFLDLREFAERERRRRRRRWRRRRWRSRSPPTVTPCIRRLSLMLPWFLFSRSVLHLSFSCELNPNPFSILHSCYYCGFEIWSEWCMQMVHHDFCWRICCSDVELFEAEWGAGLPPYMAQTNCYGVQNHCRLRCLWSGASAPSARQNRLWPHFSNWSSTSLQG